MGQCRRCWSKAFTSPSLAAIRFVIVLRCSTKRAGPRLSAHVREAEESERLRPAEVVPPAVLGGEPPELDQSGLLGVQLQVEPPETLHQVLLELFGV